MFDVQESIQSCFAVQGCHRKVLSIIAFLYTYLLRKFNIPRNCWIFFYLWVVDVFELRLCVILTEL